MFSVNDTMLTSTTFDYDIDSKLGVRIIFASPCRSTLSIHNLVPKKQDVDRIESLFPFRPANDDYELDCAELAL